MSIKTIKHIVLLFLLLAAGIPAEAQRNLYEGNKYFDRNLFEDAIPYYLKEIEKGKKHKYKNLAREKLVDCYRLTGRFLEAAEIQKNLLKTSFRAQKAENTLQYALTLKNAAMYEEAAAVFKQYMLLQPNDPMGEVYLKSCDISQKWLDEEQEYIVNNYEAVNTVEPEFAPVYYGNGMVITTVRDDSKKKFVNLSETITQVRTDLYYSPISLDEQIELNSSLFDRLNTYLHEGSCTFNADCTEIYFTRTVLGEKDKTTNTVLNSLQVFRSKKDPSGNWTEPVSAFSFNNQSYSVGQPSLSQDGKKIFFVSDRKDGFGETDIYYSTLIGENRWSNPVNLGSKINTFGHELFPYIHGNDTLYFSSSTHPGMGKLDIFRTVYKNGEWSEPENLKPPINSIGDDFGIIMTPDQNMGFFSSDRFDGKGKDDIYTFYSLTPIKLYMEGHFLRIPNTTVYSSITYKVTEEGQNSETLIETEDGYYLYPIKEDKDYKINLRKGGFFYDAINLRLVPDDDSKTYKVEVSSMNSKVHIGGELRDAFSESDRTAMDTLVRDSAMLYIAGIEGLRLGIPDIRLNLLEDSYIIEESTTSFKGNYHFSYDLEAGKMYEVLPNINDIMTYRFEQDEITKMHEEQLAENQNEQDTRKSNSDTEQIEGKQNNNEEQGTGSTEGTTGTGSTSQGSGTTTSGTTGDQTGATGTDQQYQAGNQGTEGTTSTTGTGNTTQGSGTTTSGTTGNQTGATGTDQQYQAGNQGTTGTTGTGSTTQGSGTTTSGTTGNQTGTTGTDQQYQAGNQGTTGTTGTGSTTQGSGTTTSGTTGTQTGATGTDQQYQAGNQGTTGTTGTGSTTQGSGTTTSGTTGTQTGTSGTNQQYQAENQGAEGTQGTGSTVSTSGYQAGNTSNLPPVVKYEGRLTSGSNNAPVADADVKLYSGRDLKDKKVTNNNGEFDFNLETKEEYRVIASKEGYFQTNYTISGVQAATGSVANVPVRMEPIVANRKVELENILFDFNKYNLKSEAIFELDRLTEFLETNPDVRILLNAHTDNRGNYYTNLLLSHKRATSARNYLVLNGISSDRILVMGYGETFPNINNASSEWEHEVNRRVEFKVLDNNSSTGGILFKGKMGENPSVFTIFTECPYSREHAFAKGDQLPRGTYYRILLRKSKQKLSYDSFDGVFPVTEHYDLQSKEYSYYAGLFSDKDDANDAGKLLASYGFTPLEIPKIVSDHVEPELADNAGNRPVRNMSNAENIRYTVPGSSQPSNAVFTIQTGAFRKQLKSSVMSELRAIAGQYGLYTFRKDEFNIYSIGEFVDYQQAVDVRAALIDAGLNSTSFIIAFQENKRISLDQAREYNRNVPKVLKGDNSPDLYYCVQIAASKKEVSERQMVDFNRLAGNYALNRLYNNGYFIYTIGVCKDVEEADYLKKTLIRRGARSNIFITAIHEGRRISIAEANEIRNSNK